MNTITIPAIFDTHVHLRQGKMLDLVAPYSAEQCSNIIVMPNTTPPLLTAEQATDYKWRCSEHFTRTKVWSTAKLTNETTPKMVRDMAMHGLIAMKAYPKGLTTNSDDGLSADELMNPGPELCAVYGEMALHNLVLMVHGEMPETTSMKREARFIPVLEMMLKRWPMLRISFEHITTAKAVEFVYEHHQRGCRIGASITLHHLMHTIDSVIGGKLRPDLFCKPVPKEPADLASLLGAAFSGLGCFYFGSDSAPHARETKYCSEGCAGVFSAPVLAQGLVSLFDEYDQLLSLPLFVSHNAAGFYGIEPVHHRLHLERKPWRVPDDIGGVIPLFAGTELAWTLCGCTPAAGGRPAMASGTAPRV